MINHRWTYVRSCIGTVAYDQQCGYDVDNEPDESDQIGREPYGCLCHQPVPEWLQIRIGKTGALAFVRVVGEPLELDRQQYFIFRETEHCGPVVFRRYRINGSENGGKKSTEKKKKLQRPIGVRIYVSVARA